MAAIVPCGDVSVLDGGTDSDVLLVKWTLKMMMMMKMRGLVCLLFISSHMNKSSSVSSVCPGTTRGQRRHRDDALTNQRATTLRDDLYAGTKDPDQMRTSASV